MSWNDIAPLINEFDWLRVTPQVDVPCAWLWCGWSDRYTRCWSNCCSSTAGKRWGMSGDHSQALRTSLSPGHSPPLDPRQVTAVFSISKTTHSTFTGQKTLVKSMVMYLWSVEDGWHWQHGDDDKNVSTAGHVTWHNQHFRQSRIQRKLHHEPPGGRQSAWDRDEKKASSNTGKSQKGLESTPFRSADGGKMIPLWDSHQTFQKLRFQRLHDRLRRLARERREKQRRYLGR